MAKTGTTKQASLDQENWVARRYLGKRVRGSGATDVAKGDVKTELELFECKQTGTVDKPAKSITITLAQVEKIVEEAIDEGRMPAMALRIYNPASPLADLHGNIDMTLRLTRHDGSAWD